MIQFRSLLIILWFIVCISVVGLFLSHPDVWHDPEVTVLFHIRMIIITFPIGYIIYILLTAIDAGFVGGINEYIGLVIFWFSFSIIGYLQWFVLVPMLFKAFKGYFNREK